MDFIFTQLPKALESVKYDTSVTGLGLLGSALTHALPFFCDIMMSLAHVVACHNWHQFQTIPNVQVEQVKNLTIRM